jgi:uncharacterized iron-regulated protein
MQVGFRVIAMLCAMLLSASAEPDAVADFIGAARDADIVVLGEIHDNPAHHRNQAEIVAALRPAALVLEMIPQAAEDEVNALREEGASREAIASALDWANSGWPDFGLYAAILEAAPDARVFGAGQPAADVRRAMVEGAAGVFGPDAAAYGLDRPLAPREQAAREAMQASAHCDALAPELLPGMVEAQRFRDAGLADAALWARTMTGGGQVVVIAGTGHADKVRGAPAAIATADPEVRVLTLGQFEAPPGDAASYDEVLLAPAPPRGDPCAGLSQ